MQIDNINYLRQHHRHIRDLLQIYENEGQANNVEPVSTKQGLVTLQVLKDGRPQFIHSKYDPKKEAERFIDQFDEEIDQYEHVLFYGVGLGYHVEEFMNRHPHYTFSVYEPNIEIFYEYTKNCSITDLPVQRLKEIFIETTREEGKLFLTRLTESMQERILLVVLPSYERIFQEQFKNFTEDFKEAMESKRTSFYVDTLFSARWTLNSLINFPKTIATPNILEGFDSCFKNKPLIIVSAGPSLEEEYDNLRFIKENKLAYIFAVGSANRALVAQNIMPDAVCTYDPQEHNYNVFSSLYEKGITTVPMIYGTSVGFETLDWYQGPKLHMVTSQDTVAQYYLQKEDRTKINVINDSPTIAAITFQLGALLGCNPIMFAGQNLAFKNNQFYSKDVGYNYDERKVEVMEKDRQMLVLVENVDGELIETNKSFNNMRDNIEWYIEQFPEVEAINTTKGGATITGTTFQPLEDLIKERLTKPAVTENWYQLNQNNYDLSYTSERINKMERSLTEFRKMYKDMMSIFDDMQKCIKIANENKSSKVIVKFDKLMKKMVVNDFYEVYIQPVNRTQYQALTIRAANIRKQINEVGKAKLIIESFQPYLERCKQTLEQIAGSVYRVHDEVQQKIKPELKEYKFYPSDCGVFQYEGEWKKQNYAPGKTTNYYIKQHVTGQKKSKVRFKFLGREFRIIGSKRNDGSNNIQITIDGKIDIMSEKNNTINETETPYVKQMLYTKSNLDDKEHEVEITLLNNDKLFFHGIEISKDGRLFHVHEVTDVRELEVGKRIRCHYYASINKFGDISCIGEETKEFIPPNSTAFPNGDFYFIMVDEINGVKRLIADRVIQSYINWKRVKESKIKISIKNQHTQKGIIELLREDELRSDWEDYIVNSDLNGTIVPGSDNDWNWDGITSWTNNKYYNEGAKMHAVVCRGKYYKDGKEQGGLRTTIGLTDSLNYYKGLRPVLNLFNINN